MREELQSAARRLLHGGSFSEVELWKAGCAEPTKRCLNQRCIGNNKQDWSSAAPLEAFHIHLAGVQRLPERLRAAELWL